MVSMWPQWGQVFVGSRYNIWDLVVLVWPIRSQEITTSSVLVKCWNSSVALVLVSGNKDLCHARLHPTWFKSINGYWSWPVASDLHSGHLPVGLCHGQGSLLLAGPRFHFLQCHNGLVSNRSEHACSCHPITRGEIWYGKSKGFHCLHPQLHTSRTLSQHRLLHRDELDPCVSDSSVPDWWHQQQKWRCCLAVFWIVGGRLSHHSGNGSWWLPLLPPYRSFWSHQCNIHHVILMFHWFPGGKLGALTGQTDSTLISAEAMAKSTSRPMGGFEVRVMLSLPFGLGTYKSLVVWSTSGRAWCAGLSMRAPIVI